MSSHAPLKIELLTRREEEEHGIHSPVEIEHVLRSIAEQGSRMVLYYGDANYFFMTTLLGVDKKGLWLEQSPNPTDNRRTLESDKLILVGTHLQVKVQFTAKKASNVKYQGYPAFYLPLPTCIYRLQRRESFRLTLAPAEYLHCAIPPATPQAEAPREVTVMDISTGGVKLSCAENDVELEEGLVYENCQISLPEAGKINVTIIVKNLTLIHTKSGQTIKRAGCQFINVDGATNILLQRYINNMQRAAKAKQLT
jgi:c-di-GMP-binding flagellar brake protein YcgR